MSDAEIVLESLREEHAAALFPILADAELWLLTDREPPASKAELAERYRRLESRSSPDRTQAWLNWAIVTRAGPVGVVQATVTRADTGDECVAEIAYVVGRRRQRRGYASCAVREMITILCGDYAVAKIAATVDARNVASLRLLAALGFAIDDASDGNNLRLVLHPQDASNPTTEKSA